MDSDDRTCSVDPGVPSCGAGPGGRLSFVVSELRDVLRQLRRHRPLRSRQKAAEGPVAAKDV
ncbi:MAG: hypothetical protein ACXVGB_10115 [Mycobacteriaceae bacterium]